MAGGGYGSPRFDILSGRAKMTRSLISDRSYAKDPLATHWLLPNMARSSVLGLIVLALLLSMVSSAFAQKDPSNSGSGQTVSLRGTVTTSQKGYTLSGAKVKLSGNPSQNAVLTVDTDENGRYEFRNLTPGTYSISIEAEGFKPITRSVVLKKGEEQTEDFILELEAVSEEVEVTEPASAITTESASAPAAIVSNTELITLPTAQEKVKEVLPTTPGVIQTLDSKLVFKGSDENQSLLIVNSARNTDPVTGSFGITVPTDAVESFAVYKTPYDASLGSFSGGLTTIETKTPTGNWGCSLKRIGISLGGKNGHLEGVTAIAPAVSCNAALIAHKLLVSETFQYDMKKTTVEGLPWPHDITKRQGFNSFTTLEAILAPNHLLTVTVNAFPMRTEHVDISALVPQPASNNFNQKGLAVSVSDTYQFESGAILSAVAQYTRFDSNAQGQGTADMLITPEGWGGNYFNQWSRRGKELQVLPMYQFSEKKLLGTHEIRAGEDIDWRSFFGTTESNPIQILRLDNSPADTINFAPGQPETPSDSFFAEFLQDHWLVNSHFSVDLGARFSTETSGWSAAFAPRVGLAYSPGKEGKTIIRGGAGVFYGVLPLLAANWAANPVRTITEFDASGTPIGPSIRYTNVYAAGLNPLASPVLPSQPGTTPRNITWNVGAARGLRRNLRLDVSYLDSHTTYLFVVNPFTAAIPGGESFMALTNTGSSMYREVETSVHYTFHGGDQVNGSYIWSRTRGDLNNLSSVMIPFSAAVIRPDVYGVLSSDIPNRFIGWGIFSMPWKVTFSPLVDVHSGYPYSALDVSQQYVGMPNALRFPSFFSLDLKAYREFRIPFLKSKSGKGHHLRLGVYTLNTTDHGNYNAVYNNVASPNFSKFAGFLYRHEGMIIDVAD
jgi:Carboxypeptidase regulatory-like domain